MTDMTDVWNYMDRPSSRNEWESCSECEHGIHEPNGPDDPGGISCALNGHQDAVECLYFWNEMAESYEGDD
jgi:hypothetical protein